MKLSDPKPDSNNYYFVIELKELPRNSLEVVTALAFESGATGTSEQLDFEQVDLEFGGRPIVTETINLNIYFDTEPTPETQKTLGLSAGGLQIHKGANQDWMLNWKKSFVPFELTGKLWVVPSWHEKPKECDIPIYIDPGMAFGTGTHETTQISTELLLCAIKFCPQAKVLDVGTGTGILAIVAAKQGAGMVAACDIDSDAKRVAKENFLKNGLSAEILQDVDLSQMTLRYDVVVANILDQVLIKESENLLRRLNPSGFLVVSGILNERKESFQSQFIDAWNLQVLDQRVKGEWVGYLLKVNHAVQ